MAKRKLPPTIVVPDPVVATVCVPTPAAYNDYEGTYKRLARDIVPGFDGGDFAFYSLAAVVCEQTGLQPSEFRTLPAEGRCAFVMRTAERLGLKSVCVDLERVAKIVGLSAKGITRYKREWGQPEVKGRGRTPDAWLWSRIRPILQRQFPRESIPTLPLVDA